MNTKEVTIWEVDYLQVGNEGSSEKKYLYDEQNNLCPAAITIEVLSGKWKPILLHILFQGTHRFNQILGRLPKISQKVLSQQLKELCKAGIVKRKCRGGVPPVVEYSVTKIGRSLQPVVDALYNWGKSVNEIH